jgi:hypothetical protein
MKAQSKSDQQREKPFASGSLELLRRNQIRIWLLFQQPERYCFLKITFIPHTISSPGECAVFTGDRSLYYCNDRHYYIHRDSWMLGKRLSNTIYLGLLGGVLVVPHLRASLIPFESLTILGVGDSTVYRVMGARRPSCTCRIHD